MEIQAHLLLEYDTAVLRRFTLDASDPFVVVVEQGET